jgi:amino acid transporter
VKAENHGRFPVSIVVSTVFCFVSFVLLFFCFCFSIVSVVSIVVSIVSIVVSIVLCFYKDNRKGKRRKPFCFGWKREIKREIHFMGRKYRNVFKLKKPFPFVPLSLCFFVLFFFFVFKKRIREKKVGWDNRKNQKKRALSGNLGHKRKGRAA